MLKKLVLASILFAVIAGGAFFWVNSLYTSPGNYTEQKHIFIEKGSGINSIFAQLAQQGVVENPKILAYLARFKGENNLRYGEYIIEPGMSPAQIVDKLRNGEVVVRKITVPEGKTVYDIVSILQSSEGLTGNIPENIAEGSLMPQTYYYEWGDSYEKIIGQMQTAMTQMIDRLWEFRRMDSPIQTKEDALIMASIVEKETGNADERPMVASVFINRLKIGMPLQSDPTSVYGITAGAPLGRLPTGADMKNDNPYNTYLIKALPPGPICNPGAASLEAVMNPPDTDFLYFVADGAGGHNFSTSLAGHNQNVNSYRKARAVSQRQKSEMIIKP